MEVFFILVVIGLIAAICWKYRITPSLLALIGVLALTICCLAFVGVEKFVGLEINNASLMDAGLLRPSVFNCADEVGRTPEMNRIHTITTEDMK